MAKVLKDAALIVGGIALAVGTAGVGVGLAAGLSVGASLASVSVAGLTLGTLATISAGLSVASGLLTKAPKPIGNPMTWQSDPEAGIPIVAGRAYTGGKIIYRQTYGKDNVNEQISTIYSIGPIKAFENLYVDSVLTGVDGTTADIYDKGKMYVTTQLGAQPEALALGNGGAPGVTSASKASGLAGSAILFVYDTNGGHTLTTEPQVGYVVQGVRVYDPRQDSTYPGGAANGTQRWNDETTWSYAGYDNPYLFALAWLIGWKQNGKPVAGVGVPISAILLDQFVEGANVADANAWKMGGVLDTTDDKWGRLKDILQAGGGVPMRLGAQIGCIINTPKTSLATIGVGDVVGDASVQATQAQRDRINAIVPRYMAELDDTVPDPSQPADSSGNYPLITHVTWSMVAASPVVVSSYVTFDGKQRQKQVDYTFVQNLTQSQQLARYDIENSREFGPIVLPLKLRWMGYKPGDVVTCNLPELGLNGQDILLLQRELSPQDMTVTMTARSETAAKHAFALGQTGTAPPTPSVTGPPAIPTPGNSAWALVGGTITSAGGTTIPVLQVTGSADSSVIDAVVFQYRLSQTANAAAGPWINVSTQPPAIELLNITGVQDDTAYDVSVAYRMGPGTGTPLILGPAVAGQTAVPWQAGVVGPGKPQDGATVGAPSGTPVGTYPDADQVYNDINFNATSLANAVLAGNTLQALMAARTLINGVSVATVVQQVSDQSTAGNASNASNISLIGASNAGGTAFLFDANSAQTSDGQSISTRFSNVESTAAGNSASITNLQQTLIDPGGTTVRAVVQLNVNGQISGTIATNNGAQSTFAVLANVFQIVDPNSGKPFTPFSYANGVITMTNVVVDTLTYSALVPVLGGNYNSLTATGGFQMFPGGFMMQWGKVRQTIQQETTFTVTFPKPFPTGVMASMATPYLSTFSGASKDLWMQNVGAPSTTQAVFATQASTPDTQTIDGFDWIAFGY